MITIGSELLPVNARPVPFDVEPLSFAAGETRKTISVAVASDSRREDAETFAVMLQNAQPAAQVTAATAIGTILNDDP